MACQQASATSASLPAAPSTFPQPNTLRGQHREPGAGPFNLSSADFSSAGNPQGHFLSSACGHNKDVFYRRVELTRRGHNFNCAAGAVGSFYLGRRPPPKGFFAASHSPENGSFGHG